MLTYKHKLQRSYLLLIKTNARMFQKPELLFLNCIPRLSCTLCYNLGWTMGDRSLCPSLNPFTYHRKFGSYEYISEKICCTFTQCLDKRLYYIELVHRSIIVHGIVVTTLFVECSDYR